MLVSMDEIEKDTAEIDVVAAGINAEAARAVSLAEERSLGAHTPVVCSLQRRLRRR